jgi:hypothetical protein
VRHPDAHPERGGWPHGADPDCERRSIGHTDSELSSATLRGADTDADTVAEPIAVTGL